MTKIKLPTAAEAEELLPSKPGARIHKVGRRIALAKAFAAQYLDLEEIELEDLLVLTEFIKESVQKIGAARAGEADEGIEDDEDEPEMPEIRAEDAFFGTPQCTDPKCTLHGEAVSDDTLRLRMAKLVKAVRSEMPAPVYAKFIALLEDPRTELVRTPFGILLRAAPSQGTTPGGNPGLN
jgi:hypothetical protein